MTYDIFDNTILCKNCNVKMKKASLVKNGFQIRAVVCEKCGNKIVHPEDEEEYKRFLDLKGRTFRVKMRIVGNSYAVSIPREIVDFMHEQEKIMDDMVRLCFNDAKRLSLMFGDEFNQQEDEKDAEKSNNSLTPSHKKYVQDAREIARAKLRRIVKNE